MQNMIRSLKLISIALPLFLVMAQCRSSETELAPKIAGLIGTWKLVEPDSAYATTLVFALDIAHPPRDITSFKAKGKSAVNAYSLNLFAAVDGMMMADQLSSTDMAGTAAATQFEQRYFKNIKSVARYELPSDNRLLLYHGGDQPRVLVYEKQN